MCGLIKNVGSVTQSPYQIIKHTNLLSLRTDDSLAKNRLILLSSGVGDVWKVEQHGVCDQTWERLAVPTPYDKNEVLSEGAIRRCNSSAL